MGLFSRKPTVGVEDFCTDFYDTQILNPDVAGIRVAQIYWQTVMRSIEEVDPVFASIDIKAYSSDMTVIRFEVFGLAWLHQLGDKQAVAQSAFTQRYLEDRARTDIWDSMGAYNGASARSSTLGQTSETASGRAYLALVNRTRADFFDDAIKLGYDEVAVARVANRLATEVACDKGLTAGFLMLTLYEHLGCELNEQGQFRQVAVIRGLYDGVRETLRQVKITA